MKLISEYLIYSHATLHFSWSKFAFLDKGRRAVSSGGLLMNIGYLEQNGVTSTPDVPEELTASATLPRPASAGAAAASNRAHEDTILYDYPPAMGLKTPPGSARSSRHRGVNNLRKQHSVSCANHCCESKTKV